MATSVPVSDEHASDVQMTRIEPEFFLMRIEPSETFKDVERWAENGARGPAPAVFPGGMQGIPPGTSVFEELELEAGRENLDRRARARGSLRG